MENNKLNAINFADWCIENYISWDDNDARKKLKLKKGEWATITNKGEIGVKKTTPELYNIFKLKFKL